MRTKREKILLDNESVRKYWLAVGYYIEWWWEKTRAKTMEIPIGLPISEFKKNCINEKKKWTIKKNLEDKYGHYESIRLDDKLIR